MDRRKFLIGLGAASVGGSALLGTGAFTRVEAQRRVKIQVAHDSDAYLGLDRCHLNEETAPNSSYIDFQDGHLAIEMSPENPTADGGYGINSDSRTWFHNVFQICNQGKQEVCVWIEDHEAWPRVEDDEFDEDYAAYDGMRRVDFYKGDDPEDKFIGFENHVVLDVGECVCIGLMTNTKGLKEGDQLLDVLDNEIVIHADADCPETEPLCPSLEGVYECTTYVQENGDYRRTGTRFRITNTGEVATDYQMLVSDAPGDHRELHIGPETSQSRVADASVPDRGLLAWTVPEECLEIVTSDEDVMTWGERKALEGWDNLDDFYGTEAERIAAGAPEDLDDEVVTDIKGIPDEEEPDETILADDWPDMSQEAEDAGWTTCGKFDD